MILITERPSLNKIKLFKCNGECNDFISKLKINRSIPDNDINVYKVTDGTKFLCEDKNYYIENNVIYICKKIEVEVQKSSHVHWIAMSNEQRKELYNEYEFLKMSYLIGRYSTGLIKSFYAGLVPFPSDFAVFDGQHYEFESKPISYTSFEYQDIPCQEIQVEVI